MEYKGYIIQVTELNQYVVTYNNVRCVFETLSEAKSFIDMIAE